MGKRRSGKRPALTRREQQIMDVVYAGGRVTAAQVRERIDDAPSDSAIRTLLRLLEEKGHLRHESEGPRYVYVPTTSRAEAGRSAVRHLVETFFEGSVEEAMSALLAANSDRVDDTTLARLAAKIATARKKEKK